MQINFILCPQSSRDHLLKIYVTVDRLRWKSINSLPIAPMLLRNGQFFVFMFLKLCFLFARRCSFHRMIFGFSQFVVDEQNHYQQLWLGEYQLVILMKEQFKTVTCVGCFSLHLCSCCSYDLPKGKEILMLRGESHARRFGEQRIL